jgi:C-terminal peptidase prc
VSEAQAVASEFLSVHPPSEVDVVVRRGRLARSGDPQSAEQVDRDPILPHGLDPTGPLVVLVDGNTASAAEIVAAALHDYHRATVVGTRTFGKGSVQQDFVLPDGSDLHLTIQKWFGPAGESIDGNGISPDRQVALPDEDHRFRLDAEGPPPEADAQLETALSLVGTS